MYQIIRDDEPGLEEMKIHQGIMEYNKTVFRESVKQISFLVKDENNTVVGGIIAYLNAHSLYIGAIWVEADLRKHHYGSKLLQMAEDVARKQGATFSTLETFGFQAEDFYLKNGYKRVSVVPNQVLGYARISMRKEL